MTDLPLSLRDTHSGVAYVDGPLVAFDWDNSALLGGGRGVLVCGTSDPERARQLAEQFVRKQFGDRFAARRPVPGRWGLFRTSEDRDELEWRPDPEAAQPAVLFTAEDARDAANPERENQP